MPKVTIVTAAIGRRELQRCVQSVAAQTFADLEHLVVADGPSRSGPVQEQLDLCETKPRLLVLPYSTGHDGYLSHRIYGALPLLCESDWVIFLDEDNWIESNHVQSLIEIGERFNLRWVYALRNIVSWEGDYICQDNCNSLGWWPSFDGCYHHVDSNCYCIRRDVAIEFAHTWHRKAFGPALESPDRAVCMRLMRTYPQGFTSGLYTVNYRLGSHRSEARDAEYYTCGNRIMTEIYRKFPWACMRLCGGLARHPALGFELSGHSQDLDAIYNKFNSWLFSDTILK